jgi:hypothetical protein
MDIYHTGREDKEDDHKFVNERLLEVAIPEHAGSNGVTLEECLEAYFNNRIEVKRYLQRQNTMGSTRSAEKSETVHIESIEVSEPSTPLVATPTSLFPTTPTPPLRPTGGRRRADSIFSERHRTAHGRPSETKAFDEKRHLDELWDLSSGGRPRSTSIKKEVLMPAWQFFSLIPWYTDNVPQSDAQVAAHFSAQRPVLGICLKRYMVLPDGSPKRLDTYIDIPLEIGLPHFVSTDCQDEAGETGPLFGNFKLVLQSVVCHRGVRVDSGHYVSLIRANKSPHLDRPHSSNSHEEETADPWLLFDDLARDRVREVDIKQALKDESPYLLFFQVQPIDEELASRGDPPSYFEAQSKYTGGPSIETLASTSDAATSTEPEMGEWEKVNPLDSGTATDRDETTGRSSFSSNRRSSVTFEIEGSLESLSRGRTAPPTPVEEKNGFLSTSRRNSKATNNAKSRPSSQNGETRLSLTLSRLTGRTSKDKLQATSDTVTAISEDEPVIIVSGVNNAENGQDTDSNVTVKEKDKEKLTTMARVKSKREAKAKDKERKRLRAKSKDPAEPEEKPRKRGPDRECIVM